MRRACVLFLACLCVAGCSSKSPSDRRKAAAPLPGVAVQPRVYGGMHNGGNVIDFNPRDLGEDWNWTFGRGLVSGAAIWISTSDGVVQATVDLVGLTRAETDPKYMTLGTLRVHVRTSVPLRKGVVRVSLWPLAPQDRTVRAPTEK